MLRGWLSVLLLLGLLIGSARADGVFTAWPDTRFDPAIPSFEAVLGYEPGSRITRPDEALRYLEALEAAAPDRMKIIDYGTTWQGRRLVYAIIGTPQTIANLDAIKADIKALSDPRSLPKADADAIIERLPGTVWLSYGVHGNEISSTEAALLTAWHVLAGQSAQLENIRNNTVLFIDPMQNPDGRARFLAAYEQALGLEPQGDRISAEHDLGWPGGRTNHYLFDLNRDWFRISQPETKGRVPALLEWLPLVMVDAHEMGGDSTYFFAPEAVPYNPHLTASQKQNLHLFGENHARHFDRFGISYFTREIFDAFYPGYGASWPSYYGGIAMTYEQASSRGLVYRRYDGKDLSYAETIRNHLITSLSTAEVVADNRRKLYSDFYNYRSSAIEEGRKGDVKSWLIPTQSDQAGADELARLLAFQGIEVARASASFRACGVDYKAGAYVIDMAQPEKRRISVLMNRQVPMAADFIADQEARRARNLPDEIYDTTAWSLPLMFNLEATACADKPRVETIAVAGDTPHQGRLENPDATVAFLAPWGEASAARLLSAALRHGLKVKSSDEPFTLLDKRYPSGTLIFEIGENDPGLNTKLAALVETTGARIVGVNTSWVTDGPSFGSNKVLPHLPIRIAMAWDEPTNSYNAGNSRFIIERRYGYPVTPIRTDRLKSADLRHYDVLILPDSRGRYQSHLGDSGAKNLKDWVQDGGLIIGLGSATDWLADPKVDLLSIRKEKEAQPEGLPDYPKAKEDESTVAGVVIKDREAYDALTHARDRAPDQIPGAIVRAFVDETHWLAAGLKPTVYTLVTGRGIYTPVAIGEGVNVVRFAGPEELVASGLLWQESRDQLAYKPLMVNEPEGRGQVIAITQESTTRAYQDGLDLLLINAIFRGAQHARPPR
ncbi:MULTISPECIES: M14 family metallopeptidase [unclassified Iodidimonas]|uniref:M14 family metallopeptidase n=1 Tax=unclassified Iodidimonas TaxID=2626145 RepID=UPI0024828DC6|nr:MULTISPECIES: M14 family metallopeptidase [unclassified Iodidimonas]